ncbi:MAG: hypothetical protein M3N13_06445 [Candidatus Eremiobacteraeota bacterium]|nr:hypothetical protein [Candidatus Eremiobacteraeota bacterium]
MVSRGNVLWYRVLMVSLLALQLLNVFGAEKHDGGWYAQIVFYVSFAVFILLTGGPKPIDLSTVRSAEAWYRLRAIVTFVSILLISGSLITWDYYLDQELKSGQWFIQVIGMLFLVGYFVFAFVRPQAVTASMIVKVFNATCQRCRDNVTRNALAYANEGERQRAVALIDNAFARKTSEAVHGQFRVVADNSERTIQSLQHFSTRLRSNGSSSVVNAR